MNSAALTWATKHLSPGTLRHHPLFQDRISVVVLAASVLFDVATLVILALRVHHVDYPVPVHYLSLVGFDQVGAWYAAYRFVAFAVAVTVVNGLLSAKSFQRHRLTSFFLLLGAAIVSLLCLVISLAFAVIV